MGTYTELVLKCKVEDKIPAYVTDVLHYLFNDGYPPPATMLTHEFFKCPRWHHIGRGASFYHVPFRLSRFADGYIFSRSDFKNYDDEIRKFLSWIKPYVRPVSSAHDVIGWVWYETDSMPQLITLGRTLMLNENVTS